MSTVGASHPAPHTPHSGHAGHALTAGWLRVDGVSGGPRFQLFGGHFLLAGSGADEGNCAPQHCRPCKKGKFSLESTFGGSTTFGMGPAIVNGHHYTSISYGGSIRLHGHGQLHDSTGSNDVVLAPFTIEGNLVGFDGPDDLSDKPELFNVAFHGNGIAVVELDFDPSSAAPDRLYNFRSVSYDITSFKLP
jgi:hypothetical protein